MKTQKNLFDELEQAVNAFGKIVIDAEARQEQRNAAERKDAPAFAVAVQPATR
jgi:hypothetical protein